MKLDDISEYRKKCIMSGETPAIIDGVRCFDITLPAKEADELFEQLRPHSIQLRDRPRQAVKHSAIELFFPNAAFMYDGVIVRVA